MHYLLITGVSTGIGYAAVEYLIDKGFYVFGSVRKQADVDRLRHDFPERFEPLLFDVTDETAIGAAVEKVRDTLGDQGLYGLVNNAGIAIAGPLQSIPIGDFEKQFAVNVIGAMRVTKAFLPLLGAEVNSPFLPGRIVNVSSISGIITSPFVALYAASKFALESLSDGLRMELSLFGIKVVVIQPGPIKTPIWQKALDNNEKYLQTAYGSYLRKAAKYVEKTETSALEPTIVAQSIHRALTLKHPKTRYIITRHAWLIRVASYLPDRWKDRLVMANR